MKNNPAPENDPCNHNKNCTASRIKPCLPECAPECNETGWCTNETVCACHSNFKIDENGTNCVPLCDNECKHGNCVAKNKCNCTEGWEGDSCDVPFLCRLFENDEKNRCVPLDPGINLSSKIPVASLISWIKFRNIFLTLSLRIIIIEQSFFPTLIVGFPGCGEP